MFTTLLRNMSQTLNEKDGPTVPEVIEHLAESCLDTLSKPTDDVIKAGTFALGNLGHAVPYEHFEAAFIAAINAARR